MQISGLLGRVVYALLAAVLTFVIVTVIGQLLNLGTVTAYAGIIAVLVGLVTFFGYHRQV